MSRLYLALIVLLAACAPVTTSPTNSATPAPRATDVVTPAVTAEPSARPSEAPTAAPTAFVSPPAAPVPEVNVSPGVFPIMTSLRLKLAQIDDLVISAAASGVERYLFAIDAYRNGQSPALPITGPFLAAVSSALKESATPGVKRKFEIESLTVDRHVQKPWGTHAYVDVTVTLVDRAIDGNAADQRETGKLRLTGDKMFVTDGWDYEHDRWFNGFGPLPLEQVRVGVAEAVRTYIGIESWVAGGEPGGWGSESPFQRERRDRVGVLAKQVTSQIFDAVDASIDSFETIDGIWSGVATVRLQGTVVTTNASGKTVRAVLDRHVRVFLLGNWTPEVVDERIGSSDWVSGGDLALGEIDVNRA